MNMATSRSSMESDFVRARQQQPSSSVPPSASSNNGSSSDHLHYATSSHSSSVNNKNNKENVTPKMDNTHGHHAEVYVCDKRVQTFTSHLHHPIMPADSRTIPHHHSHHHHNNHSPAAPITHMPEASPNSANAAMALSSLFHHNQGPRTAAPHHSPYEQQQQHGQPHHRDSSWGGPPPPRYYPLRGPEHPPPRQSLWNRPYSTVTNGPSYAPPDSHGAPTSGTTSFESSQSFASFPTPPKSVPPPPANAKSYYPPPSSSAAGPQRYYSYPPPAYSSDGSSPRQQQRQHYHSAQKRHAERHLVTPTPKKMKSCAAASVPEEYSRKSKSLGLLCENFCKREWELKHDNMISIDEAAKSLGVERRRIYDIINILESLQIVQRKCKNAYHWLGFGRLPRVLAEIQKEGIEALPEEAARLLSGTPEEDGGAPQVVESSNEYADSATYGAKKSLGRLSRQFLQLFLVGHSLMSLTEASDRIMGKVDVSSHKEELRKAAYVKAQKTKIRRLYDIANVLASIGLVQKTDGERRSRPTFLWIYHWSPQQIRELTIKQDGAVQTPLTKAEACRLHEPSPVGVGELVDSSSPYDGTKAFLSRIHEHGGACEEHASTLVASNRQN